MMTHYHAKYYANELSKHHASNSMGKLAGTLTDIQAKVDLNPHQFPVQVNHLNAALGWFFIEHWKMFKLKKAKP